MCFGCGGKTRTYDLRVMRKYSNFSQFYFHDSLILFTFFIYSIKAYISNPFYFFKRLINILHFEFLYTFCLLIVQLSDISIRHLNGACHRLILLSVFPANRSPIALSYFLELASISRFHPTKDCMIRVGVPFGGISPYSA